MTDRFCGHLSGTMREKYLRFTILEKNYTCKTTAKTRITDGKPETGCVYDYYDGSKRVYSVTCWNGTVTSVKQVVYKSSTTTKKKKSTDPYNARDYAHPDDFYDWYEDDFWDYEDAEDYWDEYG